MIYKTTKTVTDLEFEKIYDNDSSNIDEELITEFISDYPNHTIINKLGYLIDNGDSNKSYDLTIIYELTRLI
jgi:hypothetical protein